MLNNTNVWTSWTQFPIRILSSFLWNSLGREEITVRSMLVIRVQPGMLLSQIGYPDFHLILRLDCKNLCVWDRNLSSSWILRVVATNSTRYDSGFGLWSYKDYSKFDYLRLNLSTSQLLSYFFQSHLRKKKRDRPTLLLLIRLQTVSLFGKRS